MFAGRRRVIVAKQSIKPFQTAVKKEVKAGL